MKIKTFTALGLFLFSPWLLMAQNSYERNADFVELTKTKKEHADIVKQ